MIRIKKKNLLVIPTNHANQKSLQRAWVFFKVSNTSPHCKKIKKNKKKARLDSTAYVICSNRVLYNL